MFFTQEDYRKIEQWLQRNSVKDTEFQEALSLKGTETVALVQDGHNKRVFIKDLVDQIFKLGVSDFLNVTDKYEASYITLNEAIKLIPSGARKAGQVITFLNTDGNWQVYQFKGALNQWNQLDLWEDLFDWGKFVIDSILPDEEDLTKSLPDENGNSYLSLKDRKYEPNNYSGLGRVILRKNIMEIEDPTYGKVKKNVLYQDMINKENTIYEIRYDFDLNGQEITIPKRCVLDFQGGSFSNGLINSNSVHINGHCNLSLFSGSFNLLKSGIPSKVIPVSYYKNGTDAERFQKALDVANTMGYSVQIDESLEIDKPIYIKGHIRVFGDSWRSAKIRLTTKEASIVLGWNPDSDKYNTNVYEIDIDNITITGNNIADYCITLNHATQCRFNLVYAENAAIANFRIYKSSINWYDRCYSYYAPYAFEFESSGNNSITALNAWENGGLCNFVGEIAQLNFDKCWFERNSKFFDLQEGANVRVNMANCYILNSHGEKFHLYEGDENRTVSLTLCISQTQIHIPLGSDSYLIKTSENDTIRMYVNTTLLYCPNLKNIINNDASKSKNKVLLKYEESNTGASPQYLISNLSGGAVLGFSKNYRGELYINNRFILPTAHILPIVTATEGSVAYDIYNKSISVNIGGAEKVLGYKKPVTSVEPTSPEVGNTYYNTTLKKDLLFNGTSWVNTDGTVNIKYGNLSEKPEKASNGQMYFASADSELFPIYATFINSGVVGRWVNSQGISMKGVTHLRGTSAIRESMHLSLENSGLQYYDTDLRQSLWYDGYGNWLTAEKNRAGQATSGTFETKPSLPKVGFAYFCTDRKTTEGATNGIMIYHKGNDVWVDAMGRVVS